MMVDYFDGKKDVLKEDRRWVFANVTLQRYSLSVLDSFHVLISIKSVIS